MTPHRITYLDMIFTENGITLLGLEECGSAKAGIYTLDHYKVVAGGSCENKRLGCELWILKKWPTVDGKTVAILPDHVLCLARDPRLILVAIRSGAVTIDILVTHMHTSDKPHATIDLLWKRVAEAVKARPHPEVPLAALMDINGQIYGPMQPHIGDSGHGV